MSVFALLTRALNNYISEVLDQRSSNVAVICACRQ